MMRIPGWTLLLLLATLPLSAASAAEYDIKLDLDTKHAADIKVEKPTGGRNFGDHVVSYLRIIPGKGNRVFPVFINTHNYLTCPDSDKRSNVSAVKQVSNERRSGIKVLGFFFDNPGCENPTFHMEPVLADS